MRSEVKQSRTVEVGKLIDHLLNRYTGFLYT